MDTTALLPSRLQFAFTVSFQIIYPSFTIGLVSRRRCSTRSSAIASSEARSEQQPVTTSRDTVGPVEAGAHYRLFWNSVRRDDERPEAS